MSLEDYKLVAYGDSFLVTTGGTSIGEVYEARGQWCGSRSNTKKTKLFETRSEASKWVAGCHIAMSSRLTA